MMISNDSVKISVVIPVYNVKKYVKQAVDSILAQSVAPYEVIIVDDGSTDGSGDLLEELYGHLEVVKIVHTTNHGLGEARNEGSRHVTGEFTYYFDSDDIAVPTLLEEFMLAYQRNSDLDIFCFSADSFFDTPNNSNQPLPFYTRKMDKDFPDGVAAFNTLSAYGTFYPNAWMYVFRSNLLSKHDLRFKPIIHEDEEFTPRLFFKAGKVTASNKILFKRRVRAGSIMQSNRNEKNVIGYIESINALELLRSASESKKTKKHLSDRIYTNIITISNIIECGHISLTDDLNVKLVGIKERNKSVLIYLAKLNPRVYRLFYLIKRRLTRPIYA
ncbi:MULTISPECIES: glycosyltransferase family 2 protein [Serratia]|uniref:Chondroitin polymerase n=2 Tax=Serratia ficaria TaxID=61651 RepID=A0A240BQJ6_SERFI|nr:MULTISPECIES: glycosyltransferase [Serratia]REF45567.1 glycosyltransferase involved in cell wall biosynthesis [Serratia ficaria]CAI0840425.1 Chondroitin polymerase [Serratia ficaria]CAI0872757.1 Chondroitin polymerase [Serratia ficaria]CAI0884261.1 Chondroitin polymerase [Serratia ficaria]CAI0909141.1 Chondroitin polymerase [Serratia ficaria]